MDRSGRRLTDPRLPCNVRDLGGLPIADGGGRLRRGVLLRGDDPGRGTRERRQALQEELGIRHVLDLRTAAEVPKGLESLSDWPEVTRHHLPMSLVALLDEGNAPTTAAEVAELYVRHLRTRPQDYARAIEIVASVNGPLLVHCVHGKDRTGLVVAMVLLAVGVSPDEIVADFARSGDTLEVLLGAFGGLGLLDSLPRLPDGTLSAALVEADPRAMQLALDQLLDDGDPLDRLRNAGLSDDVIVALRHRLVTE